MVGPATTHAPVCAAAMSSVVDVYEDSEDIYDQMIYASLDAKK
jgi:hypothetical protein